MSNTYLGTLVDDDKLAQLRAKAARMDVLEDAITNASLLICESSAPECRAAMKIFGKVMDEAARKRMGI